VLQLGNRVVSRGLHVLVEVRTVELSVMFCKTRFSSTLNICCHIEMGLTGYCHGVVSYKPS
jgi:hypothetical protein